MKVSLFRAKSFFPSKLSVTGHDRCSCPPPPSLGSVRFLFSGTNVSRRCQSRKLSTIFKNLLDEQQNGLIFFWP